jgi:Uma2 family endonuclease
MSAPALIKVDKAAFYRFIANAPDSERYEYVKGRIVQQQPGGTLMHATVAKRFARLIEDQLEGDNWVVLNGSDRGVETAETIRYPDVVVEPVGARTDSLSTDRPVLIFEVLSPSSSDRDLTTKPAEYTRLSTLHAYIVASQTAPECLIWLRRPDGTFADDGERIGGQSQSIVVPSLNLTIPLAEIYRGIVGG